jgi:hypothetical protein
MRAWWMLILLSVALAGCSAPAGDPYTAAGQAQGAIQATAQARVDNELAARRTADADELAARQTAWVQSAQSTGAAATALGEQDRAVAAMLAAGAQATADAVWLNSIQVQATATQIAAQQTQAALDTDRSNTRLYYLFMTCWIFVIVLMGILLLLAWHAAQWARDMMQAKADFKNAEVRRKLVVETTHGLVDISKGIQIVLPAITGPNAPAPELLPLERLEQPEQEQPDEYVTFVMQAANTPGYGWDGTKIPGWREMGMGGAKWHRITNEMAALKLIEKTATETRCLGNGRLRDLYAGLLNHAQFATQDA